MHAQGTRDGQEEEEYMQELSCRIVGYGDEHSSWEPDSNLNAACLLDWHSQQSPAASKARTGVVVTP